MPKISTMKISIVARNVAPFWKQFPTTCTTLDKICSPFIASRCKISIKIPKMTITFWKFGGGKAFLDFLENQNDHGYEILHSETEMDQALFIIDEDSNDVDVDVDVKTEVTRVEFGISEAGDDPSRPKKWDEIPPEEEEESYLNDILELADDADDPP
ncbi:hypothetical protein Fcan01_24260 [Folsomia candida]|uniref:Uncharacterized protein n=1 Tax=Folsomia candida TaxID=158441 RepID=A0A226D8T6_FOLCA|nr:hypothetical protein Fcan01_24260 [Folsomia candida]